ncbi:MAG: hypothetical protein GX642_02600 [Smithella sp.]|jgi:hypothetical protein|nr:hypothetical protein [Smithella sp.]
MGEHIGGGKIGMVSSSWPFGKLSINYDGINLNIGIRDAQLKKEDIQSVLFRRGLINKRFIFIHENKKIKKVVEFWTFSPDPVLADFRVAGYFVNEDK